MPLPAPLAITLALLLAALARCESPAETTALEGSAGRFVLAEVDGEPLPASMVTHDHGATYLVADTLWLETDGTGEHHTTYRTTDYDDSEIHRGEDRFTYHLRDGRIEISFECNDVIIVMASCIAPPHMVGSIGASRIVVIDLHENELRYERD